jgi:hypothetical protein
MLLPNLKENAAIPQLLQFTVAKVKQLLTSDWRRAQARGAPVTNEASDATNDTLGDNNDQLSDPGEDSDEELDVAAYEVAQEVDDDAFAE